MKKEFILQGFTPQTHQIAVKRLFECPDIQCAIFSVAFVNESGVSLLSENLRQIASRMTVYAGIRNDITSRQGLDHLFHTGVRLYTVDTGARNIIFHPKLYFVLGKREARLVIGSANFTVGGLNNNIEAGVAIDLDLHDPQDKLFADDVLKQFKELSSDYPDHVTLVKSADQLQAYQDAGRLLDESAVSPPRPVAPAKTKNGDELVRIKLKVKPLYRAVSRKTLPTIKTTARIVEEPTKPISPELNLLWQSKPLTERDLTIPSGRNTHATGSINLDKGLLEEDIDHRHYFRDEIFSALIWKTTNRPTVEEAHANFFLVIKGLDCGEFNLRIGHTTDTSSRAYQQRNAMTRLSWGGMRKFVAKKDLIGRTLSLYRDSQDPRRFLIEID